MIEVIGCGVCVGSGIAVSGGAVGGRTATGGGDWLDCALSARSARATMASAIAPRSAHARDRPRSGSTWSLAERLQHRSLDQPLHKIDLVRIETHRASDGADLRRGLLHRLLDVLPFEGILHDLRPIRNWRNAAKRDA